MGQKKPQQRTEHDQFRVELVNLVATAHPRVAHTARICRRLNSCWLKTSCSRPT